MTTIDCTVEAGDWPDANICSAIAQKAILAATDASGVIIPVDAEVSLLLSDDRHVQLLNAQWREQDKPTNVLSFAANEDDRLTTPMLGDIVLAYETIRREAIEQEKAFNDHLAHLIIHGFLHLVGFDHVNDDEAESMEKLEIKICAGIGIADPYAAH